MCKNNHQSSAMILSVVAVVAILFICKAHTFNVDELISTANIYYQSPLERGVLREVPLNKVKELEKDAEIKVIIHGFIGSRVHTSIKPLGQAYKARGVPNILLADWEDAAGLDYRTSRKAVHKVAVHFGRMLDAFLIAHDIARSDVHIIGHSLGAHIAGGVGKYFNGTLGRVTGLDPALPLFTSRSNDALRASAAQFVDVIHTDYPVFGDLTPRGTVDFYPNFGQTPQRGCDEIDLLSANSCSHNRAVLFYAESIGLPQNFPALPCSLTAIKLRSASNCFNNLSTIMNPSLGEDTKQNSQSVVYMGEQVSKSAAGLYYLATYDTPPYGIGAYSNY